MEGEQREKHIETIMEDCVEHLSCNSCINQDLCIKAHELGCHGIASYPDELLIEMEGRIEHGKVEHSI